MGSVLKPAKCSIPNAKCDSVCVVAMNSSNLTTWSRASYQALKHRFADMKMWLEAAHAASDAAADAVSAGAGDAAARASAAKAYTGDYGAELAQDCVQLHGGIGVTFEHDLHLYLRRITLDRVLYGTPADHRQRLATLLIGREEAAA